jgi:uncharacterized integral membrane protein (TIGR00698 family)
MFSATPSGALRRVPGIALCVVVALAARTLQAVQLGLFGTAWLEGIVLAILLGAAVRSLVPLGVFWQPGIEFSARTVLEVAVALLGLSLSAQAMASMGGRLIASIAGVVVIAIAVSFVAGRALGLSSRMAMLVACGNAICGNSAIAAVAPVIGASADDVASSIAFTAVLGVLVVLLLPLLIPLLHLTYAQYGMLAGLTVYAVPQVLAATVPVSALSAQVGTLVKLVRVLMLGPVVLTLSIAGRRRRRSQTAEVLAMTPAPLALSRLVPWFIVVFLLLALVRAIGVVPAPVIASSASVTGLLTVVAMAALGLGVDLRVLGRVGARVTLAVVISLVTLVSLAALVI